MKERKSKKQKSLKGKLLVWFLVLALAPLGALSYFAAQNFMNTLVERQIDEYRLASQLLGKNLAEFMNQTALTVEVLSKTHDITSDEVSPEEKLERLKAMVDQNPLYLAASLTDSEGKIIVDTRDRA